MTSNSVEKIAQLIARIDNHTELFVTYDALNTLLGVARAFVHSPSFRDSAARPRAAWCILQTLASELYYAKIFVGLRASDLAPKDSSEADLRHQLMIAHAASELDVLDLRDLLDEFVGELEEETA